ncbi:MAG: MIP/aquaporin family protein [Pirellulaceae bacterium]
MSRYLTEFIGTFFLVLTIGLCVTYNVALAPLAIGCSLMIMVYMGGHISGGHYNPAVSLSAMLRGALKVTELVPYWVAQVAGAIVAALVVSFIIPAGLVVDGNEIPQYFGPAPGEGFQLSSPGVWIIEILFTFALCLVVLNTATSEGTEGNSYFGLAIGFTVVVGAFAGGHISGGAFNPAVGIGPNLIKGTLGGTPEALQNIILHTIGPFVGGLLAVAVFKLQEATITTEKDQA